MSYGPISEVSSILPFAAALALFLEFSLSVVPMARCPYILLLLLPTPDLVLAIAPAAFIFYFAKERNKF